MNKYKRKQDYGVLAESRRGFLLQQCLDGTQHSTPRPSRLPSSIFCHLLEAPSNCPEVPATAPALQSCQHDHVRLTGAPRLPPGLGGHHQPPDQPGALSFIYLSMSSYSDHNDVALKNFAKYFLHQLHEEREHAETLMKLQNQGGGQIFLQDIKKPEHDDWDKL